MEIRLRELSLAARPFLSAMEARLRQLSLAARPFLSAMEVRLRELSLAARPFLSAMEVRTTTSASSPAASSGAAAAAAAASIYAFPNPYRRCPSTGRASHLHSCDAELQRKMLQEKERRPFVIETCTACRGWGEVRDAAGERCNDPKYGDRGKLIHRTKEDAQEECDRLVAMGQASREAGIGCRVRQFPCGKHFHVGHY